MIRLGDGLDIVSKGEEETNSWVLALLTEWIVVSFMKLDNMRRDQFGGKDSEFNLMH